jgi:hypothetical protein
MNVAKYVLESPQECQLKDSMAGLVGRVPDWLALVVGTSLTSARVLREVSR